MALARKTEIETAPDPLYYSSSTSPVVGNIVGLTILIDFVDNAATVPKERVDSALNFPNYRGTMSSVRDYFYEVSSQKLTYTNFIAGYYRADSLFTWYDDPNASRARILAQEAVRGVDPQVDFTQITASSNTVLAVNILHAGRTAQAWAKGLWPHSGSMSAVTTAEGVRVSRYQMTGLGTGVSTGTIIHENGHMVCRWPDLYDYGGESKGAGAYCVMSSGGVIPNAYFRARCGWETPVDITNAPAGTLYRHVPNSYSCFVYRNVNNTREFFYIESRRRGGRLTRPPDSGLLIWHIDETGSNNNEQMTPTQHYLASVEQADGQFHLEKNTNSGADGDLYHQGDKIEFSATTAPNSNCWNGTASGLTIGNVSRVGAEMTFTIGTGPVGIADRSTGLNGMRPHFSVNSTGRNLSVTYTPQRVSDVILTVFDSRGRLVGSNSWKPVSSGGNAETRVWQHGFPAGGYVGMLKSVDRDGVVTTEKTQQITVVE
ncbi:MAG: M6 family metalloprotease domain-containing protein [Chitinispirillaceae bacterium]|nr:M6 family metalloprotease domain-containing protein [Chitinispirillaceae bacterium]